VKTGPSVTGDIILTVRARRSRSFCRASSAGDSFDKSFCMASLEVEDMVGGVGEGRGSAPP